MKEFKDYFKKVDPDVEIDPDELAAGIEVEMEHTNDRELAELIAKQHLTEPGNEKYYTNLKKIEPRH